MTKGGGDVNIIRRVRVVQGRSGRNLTLLFGQGTLIFSSVLAVIAIIAVLAALLLSALSRGKAQVQASGCRNHLRQIGQAMTMYLSD
jgi:hypothetical protein